MAEPILISDVDFLPASYRNQGAKRKTGLWRLVVVALFGALAVFTTAYQRQLKFAAQLEAEHIESLYPAAMARNQALSDLQSQLAAAQVNAELSTYLRHPWPRTQIVAAISRALPDSITLRELNISREIVHKPPVAAPPPGTQAAPTTPASLPAQDLERLRAENDESRVVVLIVGTTQDVGSLHEYLGQLAGSRLFQKVELGSIETSASSSDPSSQFTARLIVRPSYGQPGGPESNVGLATAAPTQGGPTP